MITKAIAVANTECSTKVLVPGRGNKVLRRSRLIDMLHDRVQARAQIVSSPAGYGKTTLLVDFANDLDAPVCWYTFDATDGDPRTLLEGMLASICTQFPGFGRLTKSRLSEINDLLKNAPQLLDVLAKEIGSDIRDYFVLVLDDYHCVESSESAKLLLNLFLERIPENCHVIISSRTHVDLPVVSRQITHNLVGVLTVPELSFTPAEVKELLAVHYGLEISNGTADKLIRGSEGWIIGVMLGIRGLHQGKSVDQLPTVSENALFLYLTSEVYDRQTPEVQNFLSVSGTLDDLIPEICDELLQTPISRRVLRLLDQRNLFIQCIDESNKWYRYHQLFRDFLQTKLLQDDTSRYMLLHYKAGLIFERRCQWGAAISHYIAARRYEEVVKLVKKVGEDFNKSGKWTTILGWLEAIPHASRTSDPELELLYAQTLVYLGRTDEAAHILADLIGRLSKEKQWLLKAKALSWRSAVFRLGSYFREAKADVLMAIRLLEDHQGPADLLGDAHRRLGDIHKDQGRFTASLRHHKRALKYFTSTFDVSAIASVHNSLGVTYKRLGDLPRAKMHFEKARAGRLKANSFGALALTLNNIGIIYQRTGQYDLALETFRSGLEKARETSYRRVEATILISMAEVLRDLSRYEQAIPIYNEGLELARQLMEASLVAYATAGLGETYRLLGQRDRAEMLLKEARHHAEEQEQPYEVALFDIPLAVIEYEQRRYDVAVTILYGAIKHLKTMGDRDALARAYFHLAQASFLSLDYGSSLGWLEKASGLADELGYEEFLVTEGKNAIPLIQYGATKRIGGTRFSRILAKVRAINENEMAIPAVADSSGSVAEAKYDVEAQGLGQTKVTVGARPVIDSDWRSNRAKEIFFYLLDHADGQTKEQITGALWPDLSPAKATSNFHINLFRARRALFPGIFVFEDCRYKVNPNLRIWFDVMDFESRLAVVDKSRTFDEQRLPSLEQTLELYSGHFLAEFYTEWIEVRRRELEDKYLRTLLLLTDYYSSKGEHHRTVTLLEKFIAIDPYEEEAYCRLIRSYLAVRNKALALRVYRRYAELVGGEKDANLSHEIKELYQRMLVKGSSEYRQN